jgi:hypothetical protein
MTIRTYSSPQAFKQALEQRLRTSTRTGADLARERQLLVFDRFLARAVAVLGDAVMLKGGLVLELRIERARTTKDIDLRMTALLATVQRIEAKRLRQALEQTFGFRKTHSLPARLRTRCQPGGRRTRRWPARIATFGAKTRSARLLAAGAGGYSSRPDSASLPPSRNSARTARSRWSCVSGESSSAARNAARRAALRM